MKTEIGIVKTPRLDQSKVLAGKNPGVAELVGLEILESRFEPAAWATALAESDGRKQEALAIYARLRIEQLNAKGKSLNEKRDRLEARRLIHCLGSEARKLKSIRSVQDLLRGPQNAKKMNLPKPKLSIVWLFVLMLGTASFVSTAGRLLAPALPHDVVQSLSWYTVMSGLLALGCALALWAVLPKPWIRSGWNLGLVSVCNVACLASLLIGAKLIKRAIAHDEQVVARQMEPGKVSSPHRSDLELQVARPSSPLLVNQAP